MYTARDAGHTFVSGDGIDCSDYSHQIVAKHLSEGIRKYRMLN